VQREEWRRPRASWVRPLRGSEGYLAPDPLRVAAEVVTALADAVVVTGLDRCVLTANRAAAQLFGRPLNDLPGTASNDLVMRSAGGVSAKSPATFRGAPEAHMCCSSSTSYVRPHRLHSTFESPTRNG